MNALIVGEVAPSDTDESSVITTQDTQQSRNKKLIVRIILLSILCQYYAFQSLSLNLSKHLQLNQALNWSFRQSSNAAVIFAGINSISMLISAIISDAKVSRGKMIIIGFPLYLIGYILFTLSSTGQKFICSRDSSTYENTSSIVQEKCAPVILTSLILIAIGDGIVKSNIITLGADQTQTSRYFDQFVIIINTADIIEESIRILLLNNQHYLIFNTIATTMLFVAFLLFISGWRYYFHVKPYDSVLINCIPVYRNAFQTWRQYKKSIYVNKNRPTNPGNRSNHEEVEVSRINLRRPSTFLDFAKLINHGKFPERIVNDVKSLQNALIICALVVPYWVIFGQLHVTFPAQADHMASRNRTDISVSTSLMFISECLIVIIGVLVLNTFVYRYLSARNRSLTIAKKFSIAMFFAFITMCIAGSVEILRENGCPENTNQSNTTSNNSNLSIYAQIPQYISFGLTDLFGTLAVFEFAYLIAPRSAQSLFMSLYFISRSIISHIFIGYVGKISTYFGCNTNESWLSYTFFYILAIIQIIFLIIFIICYKSYRIIKFNRTQIETDQPFQLSSTR